MNFCPYTLSPRAHNRAHNSAPLARTLFTTIIMPSSNATRNERYKRKRAQETLQEKQQRRLERRQKYAARDPETIERQRKRRNERDRQIYAAMDKDEKKLRERQKCERSLLRWWDKDHIRLKQRITNLTLTEHQFETEFIKKTDSDPHYNTKWMHEILSIESDLYMHMQQCNVEYAHREIQSLALDMDCIIIKQLKEISVHRSIIDSMIYTMYTRENFECIWNSWQRWFGYEECDLRSIFINALKQAKRIQRNDCDEAYDEDGCNDDDDGWAEDCCLGVF